MATINKKSETHCEVHLQSLSKSALIVEVHMSSEQARRLMDTDAPNRKNNSILTLGDLVLQRLLV